MSIKNRTQYDLLALLVAVVATIILVVGWMRYCDQAAETRRQMSLPTISIPTASTQKIVDLEPASSAKPHSILAVAAVLGTKTYSSEKGCLSIIPRDPSFRPTLYPFHVEVKTYDTGVVLSCGLFPTIQGDGWRVAYCPTDKGSKAVRTYLYADDGRVTAEFGEDLYGPFTEGACK